MTDFVSAGERYSKLRALEDAEPKPQVRVSLIDSEGRQVYSVVDTECRAVWKALSVKGERTDLLSWRLEIEEV